MRRPGSTPRMRRRAVVEATGDTDEIMRKVLFPARSGKGCSLFAAPPGPAGAVFQRDAQAGQPLADLVGQGEVLRLPCGGAQVDEQLHQAVNQVMALVVLGFLQLRLLEDAQELA